MSVLIKGMKVPENCGDCPFCIFSTDEKRWIGYCNTSDDDYYCKALDRFMEYDKVDGGVDILGKPNDCPLVEIPTPHGRLIDADKQWEVCKELVNDVLFPMDSIDEAEIVGMVKNAQTVIESEE